MTHPFSDDIPVLLQKHFEHLRDSAISIDIMKERGYKSVLGKAVLEEAGFSKSQQRHPGILIPLYGVDGGITGYQYRPDNPRTDNNSKRVIKYENPAGASIHLDILPRSCKKLGDPSVPLWFTEGIKKVDALTSAGVCAIGLTGVWGFKGKNHFGQSTILADFDYIALKGRHCYLCFDSDYTTNPHVKAALDRLSEHLKRKGAITHIIQLPSGPEGKKYGADDYLAAGHTIQDILNCEIKSYEEIDKETLYSLSGGKYKIEDGQICSVQYSKEGGEEIHPLCNFNASIKEVIIKDDGLEQSGYFKLSGINKNGQYLPEVEVPINNFNAMNWVTSAWHINAIIESGQIVKDRLREAIMLQSQDAVVRNVYTHLGWRRIGDEMVFLSSAGGLGNNNIEVELEPQLGNYYIPEPDNDPVTAMQHSMDFLYISPRPHVTFPLWACMYLAPLADIIPLTFTLWYVGASGTFKSTLTSLALCHFGIFDERHMPASWIDTENHLEKMLFLAKDVPFLIDDWAPGQDQSKSRQLEAKSERIVRAQGNLQGRGRMRADTTSRPSYIPRGLLITSGEQLPTGHSHNARIYTVELEPRDIDIDALSGAQQNSHHYRMAMSHYLTWLQQKYDDIKKSLPNEFMQLREEARSIKSIHPRLPEVVALLNIGMKMATDYAVEIGVIKDEQAATLRKQGAEVFTSMAIEQGGRVEDERPAKRFIDILIALKDSGSIVFGDRNDDCVRAVGPNQTLIGWKDSTNGHVLLLGQTAYKVVKDYCHRTDEPFNIYYKAVVKDLLRQGYIEPYPAVDDSTWLMRIAGAQRRVLKIKKTIINEENCEKLLL
jgi:hypothetical protein